MDLEELVTKAIASVKEEKILGQGADGIVYAINKKIVLKMHRGRNGDFYHYTSKKTAEYEFTIGKELHAQGVQVPEYIGLFKPFDLRSLQYWGIFMERIYGVTYKNLPSRLKTEAKQQYDKQIDKISKLGYTSADSYVDHNSLFNKRQQKLFLYDFVRCRIIPENHLNWP